MRLNRKPEPARHNRVKVDLDARELSDWNKVRAWWYLVDRDGHDAALLAEMSRRCVRKLRERARLIHGDGGKRDVDAMYRNVLANLEARRKRRPSERPLNADAVRLSKRPPIVDENMDAGR